MTNKKELQKYMIDQNNVITIVPSTIGKESAQKIIGLVKVTEEYATFLFGESSVGSTRTSSSKPHIQHAREYLFKSHETMLTLRDVIELTKGKIVADKEDADFDLSPENLEKDTFIKLMIGEIDVPNKKTV